MKNDEFYKKCFDAAARSGDVSLVRELARRGVDIDSMDFNPLIGAVTAGQPATVATLLELGADPNVREGQALKRALGNRQAEIAELLLKYGADVSSRRLIEIAANAVTSSHDSLLRSRNAEVYEKIVRANERTLEAEPT